MQERGGARGRPAGTKTVRGAPPRYPVCMRPDRDEYAEYYGMYVDQVPDGDVLETLSGQMEETQRLLASIDEGRAGHRYEPGKWSTKEVVGHVLDIERVFSTRALAFARGDGGAWPGVDQDDYVAAANFDRRTLADLARELGQVRAATLSLFRSLDGEQGLRRGTASGCEFSARAVAWILAGHERHHAKVLQERYL